MRATHIIAGLVIALGTSIAPTPVVAQADQRVAYEVASACPAMLDCGTTFGVLNPATGVHQTITLPATTAVPGTLAWRDERTLAFSDGQAIIALDVAALSTTALTALDDAWVGFSALAPDGGSMAYATRRPTQPDVAGR